MFVNAGSASAGGIQPCSSSRRSPSRVVPLDNARRLVERDRRADVRLPLDYPAVMKGGERLVDGAVVAPG